MPARPPDDGRGDPLDLSVPVERARPRGGRFLAASAVVLAAAALAAYLLVALLVAARSDDLHGALRARLEALAAGRAEVLATWLDGLARLGLRLSGSDLVQLYVYEAGLVEADGEALAAPLAEQAPYMQRLVDDFAARHGLAGATLLDRHGRPVLARGGARLTPAARRRALAAAAAGRRFTPVREAGADADADEDGGGGPLVMDVVLPITLPQPMAGAAGIELAGALVMTAPVAERLAEILHPGPPLHRPGERVHLLQADEVGPRRILLDAGGEGGAAGAGGAVGFGPLPPGADIEPGAPLTYARLTEVGGVEVLAVGVPVEGLPWTVLQEVEVGPALEPLRTFSLTAALVAALAALILALAFAAFWWRQSGVHHRELAAQYRDLAGRVHRQRRLLEGVAGAIREMIGLKDPHGRYVYVNPAFAEAVGRPVDAVVGRTDRDLFPPAFADRLAADDRRALAGDAVAARDDALDPDEAGDGGGGSGRRHWQTTKVPFRDADDGAVVGVVTVGRDVTELVEARAKRERAIHQAVQALVRTIELRDPYLVGHSRRVGRLCDGVARRLGLPERDRETLRLAAALSQIGKVFVPAEVLRKPGRHTDEETRIMRGHVDHAVRVLREIDFELPVAEAIEGMYERLDGTGYPRGLEGDAIGLLPRILGAADVYCARTAPRSYRDRVSRGQALHFLIRNPGRYDLRVIEALAAATAEREDDVDPAAAPPVPEAGGDSAAA